MIRILFLIGSLLTASVGNSLADDGLNSLSSLANSGNVEAQRKLGIAFLGGDNKNGILKNEKMGVYWLRLAAKNRDPIAQNYLGIAYWNGSGVPQNKKEAVNWYKEAAKNGETYAQTNLAFAYEFGIGTERNLDKLAIMPWLPRK